MPAQTVLRNDFCDDVDRARHRLDALNVEHARVSRELDSAVTLLEGMAPDMGMRMRWVATGNGD